MLLSEATLPLCAAANKFPCFVGNPAAAGALKQRFKLELSDEQLRTFVNQMVADSLDNWGTIKYDQFQELSNGIVP